MSLKFSFCFLMTEWVGTCTKLCHLRDTHSCIRLNLEHADESLRYVWAKWFLRSWVSSRFHLQIDFQKARSLIWQAERTNQWTPLKSDACLIWISAQNLLNCWWRRTKAAAWAVVAFRATQLIGKRRILVKMSCNAAGSLFLVFFCLLPP